MASIPILAAVVSAIVIPVVGTGIYYSVKPSKEETTNQQQERTPRVPGLRPHTPSSHFQDTLNEHGVRLPGRLTGLPGGSVEMDNFIKESNQKRDEAFSSIEHSLNTGRPQSFGNVSHTSSYASGHSTIGTRLSR